MLFHQSFFYVRMREHLAKHLSMTSCIFGRITLVKINEAACNPCESTFPEWIRSAFLPLAALGLGYLAAVL